MFIRQKKNLPQTAGTQQAGPCRIESLEGRVLFAVTMDIVLGAGGVKSVTYPAVGGTTATIAFSGPGSATAHFTGDTITPTTKNNATTLAGADITVSGIDGTQTTTNTILKVTTKGGTGTVGLGRITSNGSYKSIQGTAIALTGGVVVTGAVGQINVQRITGGPITLATGTATTINVATNATFNLTAGAIKSISVGGSLTNSTISLSRATQGSVTDLNSLSVKGSISGLVLNSRGSLGNLSAVSLLSSTIFSGVGTLATGQLLPNSSGDFTNINKISSLKLKKTAGVVSFFNDYVSAHNLGSLALGGVLLSNGGVPFGLAANKYNSLSFVAGATGKTLNLNNINSQNQVTNAVSKAGVNLQDFVIRVVV
ncbi:MAG TPA: hypothetical protein VK797_27555 [Tepidisphaeraceae bacterium]|nr:hypothetical protein [Tepidisphaeraceae bacterium]